MVIVFIHNADGSQPKRFQLGAEEKHQTIRIGRNKKLEVQVSLPGVSWQHTELCLKEGSEAGNETLIAKDSSSNGTGVRKDDSPVALIQKGEEVPLQDGSIVVLPMKGKVHAETKLEELCLVFMVQIGGDEPRQWDPAEDLAAAAAAFGLDKAKQKPPKPQKEAKAITPPPAQVVSKPDASTGIDALVQRHATAMEANGLKASPKKVETVEDLEDEVLPVAAPPKPKVLEKLAEVEILDDMNPFDKILQATETKIGVPHVENGKPSPKAEEPELATDMLTAIIEGHVKLDVKNVRKDTKDEKKDDKRKRSRSRKRRGRSSSSKSRKRSRSRSRKKDRKDKDKKKKKDKKDKKDRRRESRSKSKSVASDKVQSSKNTYAKVPPPPETSELEQLCREAMMPDATGDSQKSAAGNNGETQAAEVAKASPNPGPPQTCVTVDDEVAPADAPWARLSRRKRGREGWDSAPPGPPTSAPPPPAANPPGPPPEMPPGPPPLPPGGSVPLPPGPPTTSIAPGAQTAPTTSIAPGPALDPMVAAILQGGSMPNPLQMPPMATPQFMAPSAPSGPLSPPSMQPSTGAPPWRKTVAPAPFSKAGTPAQASASAPMSSLSPLAGLPGQMPLMPGVAGQTSAGGMNPLALGQIPGQHLGFGQIPGYPQLPTQVPQPGLLGGLGAFAQANPLLGLGAGGILNLSGLAPWNTTGR